MLVTNCFDKSCPTSVNAHATMPIIVLWVVIVWCSLIEVNSTSGRKSIVTRVCGVYFCHDEIPLALLKKPLASITHNALWHIRVRFYTFVGQPFLKQLYSGVCTPRVGSRQGCQNKLIWYTLLCYLLWSGDKTMNNIWLWKEARFLGNAHDGLL